jgi:hypothetical protein
MEEGEMTGTAASKCEEKGHSDNCQKIGRTGYGERGGTWRDRNRNESSEMNRDRTIEIR